MTPDRQITQLRVEKKRSGPRVIVEFDRGEGLELDPEIVVRSALKTGATVSAERVEALCREDEVLRARRRLTAYLALRVKSVADARLYLEKAGFSESAIGAALADAGERGLLDDRRFAERYVRTKLKTSALGPLRLLGELISHGIEPSLAKQVVQPQFKLDRQREAAASLARKQLRKKTSEDDESNAKRIHDFLRRRGFEDEVAREVSERAVRD